MGFGNLLTRMLGSALAGGVVGVLFLSTGWSLGGLLAGFAMGFLFFFLLLVANRLGLRDWFDHAVAGGVAGAVAAGVGWWLGPSEVSFTTWLVIGAFLGGGFLVMGQEE